MVWLNWHVTDSLYLHVYRIIKQNIGQWGNLPTHCKRYRRTDMPHWSEFEYLGIQPTVKKDPYLCDCLHTYPRPLIHSSSKSILYKFELSSAYVTSKELRIYNSADSKGASFRSKYRNGNLHVDGRIFFWLFKIDKLTTSIYMDHAFVLLINRTGTDITAILVFKLELNKCFAFRLYYKYYDSPIHCYCDSFYTYWHTTVGSLGFHAFPRHGPVPLCLCPWKCCFCTLEKGHIMK